ncbi:hypothetical protein ARMSODRAFT_949757 [Armillaria solidipes]|uniref:Uncharacterized protein n=1 Tax=Armillaria solidipes TaxID=1076256 RepID=A0A2H3C2I0_9AGAR|nr:hypothetical protein ARMSODRAFT_949757 [Armillaria solidipes]
MFDGLGEVLVSLSLYPGTLGKPTDTVYLITSQNSQRFCQGLCVSRSSWDSQFLTAHRACLHCGMGSTLIRCYLYFRSISGTYLSEGNARACIAS